MGSINAAIAKDIIAGKYAEDKPAKIVTYENMFDGGLTFAVVFEHENLKKYEQSPACTNVSTVWTKDVGITFYGSIIMREAGE